MPTKCIIAIIAAILVLVVGCGGRGSAMEEMKARAIRRPKTEQATSPAPLSRKADRGSTASDAKSAPKPDSSSARTAVASKQVTAVPKLPEPQRRRKSRREVEEEEEQRLLAARQTRRKPTGDRDEPVAAAVGRGVAASKSSEIPQPPPVETAINRLQSEEQRVRSLAAIESLYGLRCKLAAATSRQQRTDIWRELVETRRAALANAIVPSASRDAASEFSSMHENQLAEFTSDFHFDSGSRNMVAMLVSSNMTKVVAAQSACGGKAGPGTIDVWDVFAGEKTQSWPMVDERFQVDGLRFSPDERTVVTLPSIGFYHLVSGDTSLPFGVGVIAVTPSTLTATHQFLAIGVAGEPQSRKRVLHLFRDGSNLVQERGVDAFEALISGATFANRSAHLAFAIRQRNNHRLFIGDATDLSPDTTWQVEEHVHSRSWYSEDNGNRATIPGITSLAFSPDDRLLVTSGRYAERDFRAAIWQLDWARRTAKLAREPIKSQVPILWEGTQDAIHFIDGSNLAALVTPTGVTVVDMQRGGFRLRGLQLEKSRRGRPVTAFSEDNLWLAVGDEQGRVQLLNLENGEIVSLTPSGRPAHGGAIVGIAFSRKDPITKSTEYLVTAGEENRVKLWSLAERIGGKSLDKPKLSRTE